MWGGVEPDLLAWHMGTKNPFSEGRSRAFAFGTSDMHDVKSIEVFWLLLVRPFYSAWTSCQGTTCLTL